MWGRGSGDVVKNLNYFPEFRHRVYASLGLVSCPRMKSAPSLYFLEFHAIFFVFADLDLKLDGTTVVEHRYLLSCTTVIFAIGLVSVSLD